MRVISSQQAADLLEDGMTVAASGFGGYCHPEAITAAVEERFLASGKPRKLTLLFAASTGDRQTRGMGHFGYEGLVACVIAGDGAERRALESLQSRKRSKRIAGRRASSRNSIERLRRVSLAWSPISVSVPSWIRFMAAAA